MTNCEKVKGSLVENSQNQYNIYYPTNVSDLSVFWKQKAL